MHEKKKRKTGESTWKERENKLKGNKKKEIKICLA